MHKYFRPFLLATIIVATFFPLQNFAQKKSTKKYPALLWEISGNGLKQKSYLFGTMHVSKKSVFNLSDSFFYALRSVDKVGLELNPDHWQDDMIKAENEKQDLVKYTAPNYKTPFYSTSFELEKYDALLSTLLKVQPSIINSLLYRNYNKYNEDYEEDTFLDLFIYQTGKKLGKRATGMEHLKTSDMAQAEAYRDELREKKKAKDIGNTSKLREKIEEAYRNQDLDELDSLEKVIEESEAYTNRFINNRNLIQANSMDTVMKSGASLFVGVGCAHLPGEKGVIELLRKKGYTLRPIKMNERDVKQKEEIEKMHAPVSFKKYKSDDGLYEVDMPGKPYEMGGTRYLDTKQYSDMSNGSYYMVSRLRTHAALIGDDENKVLTKVDSLLYENIPGKILSKKKITTNGYNGFEITNKTRRGDVQRYNIFILHNEVMVFKMSGPYDYILNGNEADKFFGSIKLNEENNFNEYKKYTSPTKDFSVELPAQPIAYLNKNTKDDVDRWEYETKDAATGNAYSIWHSARYSFTDIKDDSTDLELMNLSIYHSEPIVYEVSRNFFKHKNFSALQTCFKLSDSGYLFVRHIIRGAHQYNLFFHSKSKIADEKFFNSFEFLPFKYTTMKDFNDDVSVVKCKTPFLPKLDSAFRRVYNELNYAKTNFVNGVEKEQYWQAKQNIKLVSDSTQEMVFIQTQKLPIYFYAKDINKFWQHEITAYYDSTTHILKEKKYFSLPDGTSGYNVVYTDTGSTKLVKIKFTLKGNQLVYAFAIAASNEPESELLSTTFNSVQSNIKKTSENILNNKLKNYFADFYSKDEKIKNRARNWISNIRYDEEGIDGLMNAYRTYKYEEKDFYENKTKLVKEFGYITDSSAQSKLMKALKTLYDWSADTAMFQNQVVLALARLRNKTAYKELKNFVTMDPPVFESNQQMNEMFGLLNDSLKTTKTLFPEILQLAALDDYKMPVNGLLEDLSDSNLLATKDYETYFSKLFFDAKINLKKQFSKDEEMLKSLADKDAQEANRYKKYYNSEEVNNDVLRDFKLLAPFYQTNPMVKKYFDKSLQSKNNLLVVNAATALAKYKITVADSITKKLAANKMYAYLLYKKLGLNKAESLFPSAFNGQQKLTYSQIFWQGDFKKLDTVIFLQKKKAKVRNISGNVFVYKYRLDNDGPWYLGLCGIQPFDESKTAFNNLVSDVKTQLDDKKPLRKQIEKAVTKQVLQQLKNENNFFRGEGSSSFFGN